MSAWLLAGAGTMLAVGGCAWVAMRDSIMDRVLGAELGSTAIALAFLLLGEGFDRSVYFDLALVWAVLISPRNRQAIRTVAGPPVLRLRALQSGHIGDYTVWFAVGLGAVAGLFALGVAR